MGKHDNRNNSHQAKLIRKQNEFSLYEFGHAYSERLNEKADAVNEQYNDLPEPLELQQWYREFKKELEKDVSRNKRRVMIRKYASRAAVIFCVILLSAAAVTLSLEALRIKFFNLFIETGSDHNRIEFLEEGDALALPEEWENYYSPTWLPEDYKLLDTQSNDATKVIILMNDSNDLLIFTQNANKLGLNMDNEDSDIDTVPINNNEGYMIEKDGVISISWSQSNTVLTLEGAEEISEMIRIAEKIKKVSK